MTSSYCSSKLLCRFVTDVRGVGVVIGGDVGVLVGVFAGVGVVICVADFVGFACVDCWSALCWS